MGCGASSVQSHLDASLLEVERLQKELKEPAGGVNQPEAEPQAEPPVEPPVEPTHSRPQAEKCELLESCEAVVAGQPPGEKRAGAEASAPLPDTPAGGQTSEEEKSEEPSSSISTGESSKQLGYRINPSISIGSHCLTPQLFPKDPDQEEVSKVQVDLPGIVVHDAEADAAPETAPETTPEEAKPPEAPASLESTASTCSPQKKPSCGHCFCEAEKLYVDPNDLNRTGPSFDQEMLAEAWSEQILVGWPPLAKMDTVPSDEGPGAGQLWTKLSIRVRRDICGGHARELLSATGLSDGEVLAQRYKIMQLVGEGHFTKAFLAKDLQEDRFVCVKRHRNLPIEALADFFVAAKRLDEVDRGGQFFPVLVDAFFDLVGYTVESMFEGKNCLVISTEQPGFFKDPMKIRTVALGALSGLVLLEKAGLVHNDVKPDNLIWTEPNQVRIVDFGCARLDQREERGRNWALAEGGAGHLGKWSPEMTLRLPIGHQSDVWGTAVSLCELFCGRVVWRSEQDTAEVVMAQALGLCNLRDGLPPSLLRRSPLDVRQLYTPGRRHWPVRRTGSSLEAIKPKRWGLEQILGMGWKDSAKADLGEFLLSALVLASWLRLETPTRRRRKKGRGGRTAGEDAEDGCGGDYGLT
eukprot:g952.t2